MNLIKILYVLILVTYTLLHSMELNKNLVYDALGINTEMTEKEFDKHRLNYRAKALSFLNDTNRLFREKKFSNKRKQIIARRKQIKTNEVKIYDKEYSLKINLLAENGFRKLGVNLPNILNCFSNRNFKISGNDLLAYNYFKHDIQIIGTVTNIEYINHEVNKYSTILEIQVNKIISNHFFLDVPQNKK